MCLNHFANCYENLGVFFGQRIYYKCIIIAGFRLHGGVEYVFFSRTCLVCDHIFSAQ